MPKSDKQLDKTREDKRGSRKADKGYKQKLQRQREREPEREQGASTPRNHPLSYN